MLAGRPPSRCSGDCALPSALPSGGAGRPQCPWACRHTTPMSASIFPAISPPNLCVLFLEGLWSLDLGHPKARLISSQAPFLNYICKDPFSKPSSHHGAGAQDLALPFWMATIQPSTPLNARGLGGCIFLTAKPVPPALHHGSLRWWGAPPGVNQGRQTAQLLGEAGIATHTGLVHQEHSLQPPLHTGQTDRQVPCPCAPWQVLGAQAPALHGDNGPTTINTWCSVGTSH